MPTIITGETGVNQITSGTIVGADVSSLLDLTGKTVTLPSGAVTTSNLPAGSILQVVSTTKTDTWSASLPNWADITGMSVSITPSSSSSKIYVIANLSYTTTGGASNGYRIMRDSTALSIADAAGSRPRFSGMVADGNINTSWIMSSSTYYLDSPSTTSAITYKLQAFGTYAGVFYVNMSSANRDASQYDARGTSSITVMEVKA